jgi:hypothetical protein
MLVPILIAVAVVFLVLGFLHVVTLVVGLAVAVVCAVIAVAVALGGGYTRRV